MRILVTGANGFVGRHVVERLAANSDYIIRGATRKAVGVSAGIESISVGDIAASTDWSRALSGVDVVAHTAARVHMMKDRAADPLDAFLAVNTAGTMRLARQAVAAGVRRLIFLSSIKVMGERTELGRPLRAHDPATSTDPYAISKLRAEEQLRELAGETGLEIVVIRPVLVYGPGVRANFRAMMRAVERGLPMPLASIHNKRSLISVQNLASLIEACARQEAAANEIFLASDGEDLSTPDLLRRLARSMGRPSRLFSVPEGLLLRAARVVGRENAAQRLLGSLQVDIEKNRRLLDWLPELSVDDGLAITARDFLGNRGGRA